MYIGKLGDGSAYDDGVYVLIKEIIDNCIDEHVMGFGKSIEIEMGRESVRIRDYGRGIPLGKLVDCVSRINTGGKYDGEAFTKSVGLNGVGTKAVNALSKSFVVQSFRDGLSRKAGFAQGLLLEESKDLPTNEKNGTLVEFIPDGEIFRNFHFIHEFIEEQLWNYAYLNAGLSLYLNGKKFFSKDGLLDLLVRKAPADAIRYPVIHLKGDDIELAFTHGEQYGEEYYSFVNGQYTTQGGTHLAA
ncbi:MAG: hypothetical protein RIS78_200, partial [Bacteroidota bacterium]